MSRLDEMFGTQLELSGQELHIAILMAENMAELNQLRMAAVKEMMTNKDIHALWMSRYKEFQR